MYLFEDALLVQLNPFLVAAVLSPWPPSFWLVHLAVAASPRSVFSKTLPSHLAISVALQYAAAIQEVRVPWLPVF